ncbi:MAG: ATP cone domain-containing protein, partial [Candidatus Aminicenantaceae bacterium]
MYREEKIKKVKKRDGRIVPFDRQKIINAISKAMKSVKEGYLEKDPIGVAKEAIKELEKRYYPNYIPGIEEIQDVVEEKLILMDFPKTAKAYILYRQERAKIREKQKEVPKKVKELAQKSKNYFHDELGEFIYYRTYSRWLIEEQRRETWIETVDRYVDFMQETMGDKIPKEKYKEIREFIINQKVMPSMRLIWSAGKASKATNVATYNCSYIAPNKLRDFAEIMYLLMCGAGVGFSVENQNIQQLPIIKYQTGEMLPVHVIEDSKEGWGDALTLGLKTWYEGKDIKFDYSKIRPYGARLKTMGGISSGPEPLKSLMDFTRKKILSNQGKRLTSIGVYDIICKIGQLVEMGGVRRSALISLSDLEDEKMRDAKTGHYYISNPQRSMANNSAVYNKKPSATKFMDEWLSLAKSGTGERGIFNKGGLEKQMPQRRWEKFKKYLRTSGTNPCGEITLRNKQFCNLTEIVARPEDTEQSLLKKAEIAAILGTYQSSLTNFPYIAKEWKKNCDEERLLGVSITG